MIYLEYQDDTSAKFWQIDVAGNSHTVTYGKIGTQGTSKTKTFDDETACQKDADKLIKAKKAKGYAEQGQTPTKKPQTPAQKNQQAMMDELDLLIKDGNTAKAFEFLQKYKDGNITTLKKALPKLRRHWLDWREIPMPTGKTYYGRLGGDAQQQVLGVLALGLFSPSDYNNQWSWLSWQINWGWFNDDIIDGLAQVGCTVLSHIVKENKEVNFDYDMLKKLEKAGLVEYDAVAFVSGFLRIAYRHIIRHNEHLTKAYKRSKRQNKPSERVSKFANQYEYEGKTAPEPKRITIITEESLNYKSHRKASCIRANLCRLSR